MIKSNKVSHALLNDIQIATQNFYRYERFDRYALVAVLNAAKNNEEVEDVFLKQATMALKRHPIKKALVAA